MDARGIANVGSIIEDDGEESEEEKWEREARNAATVAGVLVGGAVGAVMELSKPKPTPTDNVDDGEECGMGMTMWFAFFSSAMSIMKGGDATCYGRGLAYIAFGLDIQGDT